MYYYHPEEINAYKYKNQYYFNGQLLVAPITSMSNKNKMSEIKVYLPKGIWTDIFTNDKYEGGKVVTMVRTLDSIPVLAKEGAIVVLSNDKNKNSIDNPKELLVDVYNGTGSFTLYEDNNLKDVSTTSFYSDNIDDVQYLSIISNDLGAIRKNRKLIINFKNIKNAKVYCNQKVKVNNKDYLQVVINNYDSKLVYEIQVKYEKIDKLTILKTQGKDSLTFFEGKNEYRVELFNKINNCKTIDEYIKIVNGSKLPKIYKKRLKECK